MVLVELPLVDDDIRSEKGSLDVLGIPNVGQHGHSRTLGFDFLDRRELLHVSDTVDDRVDLSAESVAVLNRALAGTNLDLPTGVEEVGTGKDDVCVVKGQDRGNSHQSK